jgi:hypothetical protein
MMRKRIKMSNKCNQCQRPGLIPVPENIYVERCGSCQNLQVKKEEVKG